MKALIVEPQLDTPSIYFEPEINLYFIEGESFPKNANGFYKPVFAWLKDFSDISKQNSKDKEFQINIKLESCNVASIKQIANILSMLSANMSQKQIKIVWHYKEEDIDILKLGKKLEQSVDIRFEFVSEMLF